MAATTEDRRLIQRASAARDLATRGEIDPWIALSLVVLLTAKIEAAQRSSAVSVPERDDDAPGSTDQREKRV